MTDLKIALLSSCTIELFEKNFASALEQRGFRASFWTGSFGQYQQDVLDPASGLYASAPSFVVLYLDGEDLFRELLINPFEANAAARHECVARVSGAVRAIAETLTERLPRATVLLNTAAAPPLTALTGLEYNSDLGLQSAFHEYNRELACLARRMSSIVVVDVAALAAWIGFSRWRDNRMWCLARSRWSHRALAALGEHYTAAICGRLGRISKCLAIDLDNTLWGGIVGEDGIEGIRLGEEGVGLAFVEFQQELLNLCRKGVLLAICSKNNAQDALQVIREHPAMRLREEHFAAMRINWEDKATNLRALAEELNIGLDSIVFLDDNPVERAWVRQFVPEVLTPDWPTDPSEYSTALLELAARRFFMIRITAEDRKRGELYQAQAERRKLESSAVSLEDFYRALEMRLRIGAVDAFTLPRIAQLTQKTNQFNLTTRRYTETEIRTLAEDPGCAVFWMDVSDRFGPNGIVGVLILKRQEVGAWLIDTFLLSCRVMGRTLETAFLAVAARELAASRLIGEYRPTPKNPVVRDLYPRLGFEPLHEIGHSRFWEFDLATGKLDVPPWFEVQVQSDAQPAAKARVRS